MNLRYGTTLATKRQPGHRFLGEKSQKIVFTHISSIFPTFGHSWPNM
ncbi:MAG: hypothetical protein V3T45_07505 [Nitrospinaceae bacterium]